MFVEVKKKITFFGTVQLKMDIDVPFPCSYLST